MKTADSIIGELYSLATDGKREVLSRFFKTGQGQYGEGDVFLGVTVPHIREIAKAHKNITDNDITALLDSEFHEARLCGLLIMVQKCHKADADTRLHMFDLYMAHTDRINNWDLVDLSAPAIVGGYVADTTRDVLYKMAESSLLWDNRIAIVSTIALIRRGELDDTFLLAEKLMGHKHDLIHKATGWMLREAGKRDYLRLYNFVEEHRTQMPRTMLRYAIEKFSADDKERLMRK